MWNVDDKFDSDSVDARNRWGQTRLFRAAEKGDIQLVKKLVADGADISLVDNEKATARIAAWRNGHKKIEEYLSTLEEERGVSPEILAEKARLAFEASEAVKRLQAQKKAALAEKKRQENERKKEEKAIWFYSKDLENREGPMSIITIKKLLKEGGISKDTLVWSPDIDEWKPVEQVVENIQPARTSSLSKQLSAATKKTASEQPAHEAEETLSLERSGPSGIGGWLLFLIVGMVLLGPLLGGGRILVDIMGVEQHYPGITKIPEWVKYKSIVWWSFFIAVSISIYGGYKLATGRNWSAVIRAKTALWISGPVASVITALIIPYMIFGEIEIDPQLIGAIVGTVIAASIWTTYLSKSKRVQNTYLD